MRLGGSLRRSRGKKRKSGGGAKKKPQGFIASRLEFLKDPRFLWQLGLLALAGFGGGYVISTQLLFPAPPPPGDLTRVPELAGEPLSAIPEILSESGLFLGMVDSLRHPTTPEGVVLGQSPLSGQLSLVGDSIRVAVSLGPEERPVPDIMRLRADRAQTVLEASGFEVMVDSIESEIPRGSVVAMEPEAGTEATLPQEIILTVSMGPPMVEMPLFLGLQEEQAMAVADSLGLVVAEVESRFRFGRDQGLVVEQEPPATTLVERGAAIRLVVGRRGG
jgi:beta-lactam-binding protein with PASTA domain